MGLVYDPDCLPPVGGYPYRMLEVSKPFSLLLVFPERRTGSESLLVDKRDSFWCLLGEACVVEGQGHRGESPSAITFLRWILESPKPCMLRQNVNSFVRAAPPNNHHSITELVLV